jgi:hypothetical protein
MPADGMRAAVYGKTEFRRPLLGSSRQIYPSFLTMESHVTRCLPSARQCLLLAHFDVRDG